MTVYITSIYTIHYGRLGLHVVCKHIELGTTYFLEFTAFSLDFYHQCKEIEIKILQHLLLYNCNFCRFVYSSNRHMKTSYWQLLRCTREEKIESHLSPIIVYLLLWSTTQTIPIVLKVFLPLNSNFSIKKNDDSNPVLVYNFGLSQ